MLVVPCAPDGQLRHLSLSRSRAVLFASTSHVMMEGLATIGDAILLAPGDPWIPREMVSLWAMSGWDLGLPLVSVSSLVEKRWEDSID